MGKRSKGIIPSQTGEGYGELMKKLLALVLFCLVSVETVTADDQSLPKVYRDYTWDVGVTGGMIFDGMHTDVKRLSVGAGLHAGYHLTENVGLHGEISHYFADISNDSEGKKIDNTLFALSAIYDFSPERSYSLYATAGLGYELLKKLDKDFNNPVSLVGFGFRYMFADSWSARIEGRWKFVLVNTDTPDNSLVGTLGADYHF